MRDALRFGFVNSAAPLRLRAAGCGGCTDVQKPCSSTRRRRATVVCTNVQSESTSTTAVDMAAYARGFEGTALEDSYEVVPGEIDEGEKVIEGRLPSDLTGTLFRNMPGSDSAGGKPLASYWDGDGMMVAISFAEDRVFIRNRFIRTKAYLREKAAKKMLYRGLYGTRLSTGGLANFASKVKHSANRSAVFFGGRLLALHAWGLPYSMDPAGLLTKGSTTIRAQVSGKMVPSGRIDPYTGHLILADMDLTPAGMTVTFVEFDDDFRVKGKEVQYMGRSGLLHDFTVTENYFVLFGEPYGYDFPGHLLGVKARYEDALQRTNALMKLFLIPRTASASAKKQQYSLESKVCTVSRIANAYETAEGEVIIDAIHHEDLFLGNGGMEENFAQTTRPGRLLRITVSGGTIASEEPLAADDHVTGVCIAPQAQGRRYRYLYGLSSSSGELSPPRALVKFNLQSGAKDMWIPPPSEFCSEPVFAPRDDAPSDPSSVSREDDGYLISVVYNGDRNSSYVGVFDAADVQAGPICKVNLRSPFPHGLHSTWTSKVYVAKDASKSNSFEIFQDKGWNDFDSGFSIFGLQGIEEEI